MKKCKACECDTDVGRLCGQCEAMFRNELRRFCDPDNGTFVDNARLYLDKSIRTGNASKEYIQIKAVIMEELLSNALDRLTIINEHSVKSIQQGELLAAMADPSIHRPQSPYWVHEDWDLLDQESQQ